MIPTDSLILSPPRVSSKNKLVLIKDDRRQGHEYRTVFLVAGKHQNRGKTLVTRLAFRLSTWLLSSCRPSFSSSTIVACSEQLWLEFRSISQNKTQS